MIEMIWNYEDCGDCFGHEYEYIECLPSGSKSAIQQELWVCIHCNHERVVTREKSKEE